VPIARASLVPKLTGALAGSSVRSQRTRLLSWMLRWKLREGCEVFCWGWGSGGRKCVGAAERVVHEGSGVVRGAPLSWADASARDWERRRSWAARN
jgi:hypothetical protein